MAGNGFLLAADWGWPLAAPLPAGVTHVGLRAHHIGLGPGENPLRVRVERIIDNVFSWILMAQTPGGGRLRLETDRDAVLPEAGSEITIHISGEHIMLLTGGGDP